MRNSIVIGLPDENFDALTFRGDVFENFRLAKDLGYDAVEIAIRDPKNFPVNVLEKAMSEFDMRVSAIGTGMAYLAEGLSLSHNDREIREKAIERLKEHMEVARLIDTTVIVGLIRGKAEGRENALDILRDSMEKVCEFAASKNVYIVIEPLNRYESDILNTAEETIRFIEDMKCENLGLLLDTFHMNIEERDPVESIVKSKNWLKHFHVADSNRWAPGFGHINFKAIFHALKDINYKGFVTVESLPKPEDAKEAATAAIRFLKQLEDEISL
ncbi:MAG: sugar phosphate isomerase/epimerase [Thermotogaceae bacterium]|nr:sugar phosphate isomerase/epimerase [Thermotogaceae bacterium]